MKRERAQAELFHEALSSPGRPVEPDVRPLVDLVRKMEATLLPGPAPAIAARIDRRFEAALRKGLEPWPRRLPLRARPLQFAAGLLLFAAGGVSVASAMGISPVDAAAGTVSFAVNAVSSLLHIQDKPGTLTGDEPAATPTNSPTDAATDDAPDRTAATSGEPTARSGESFTQSPPREPRLAGLVPPFSPPRAEPNPGTPVPSFSPTPTPTRPAVASVPPATSTPTTLSSRTPTHTPQTPSATPSSPVATSSPAAAPSTPVPTPSPVAPTPTPSPTAPSSSPSPATPTATPSPTATATPATTTSTYSAAPGGSVTVRIESDWLTVITATPASGWSVTIDKGAGSDVQVKFTSGSQAVQFWAGVQAGAVTVHVESSS